MEFETWGSNLSLGHGLRADVRAFLLGHGCPQTLAHVEQVAAEGARLASRFGASVRLARQAGLLHDVSAVIPPARRLELARQWGLEIFPEEEALPMLLHQRFSAVLARQVFGARSPAVLSAIACHTTLRPGATLLDKVVFVADKISWDQPGPPPYLPSLLDALNVSLDSAARFYLDYLRRTLPRPLHPWARAALEEI